MSMFYINETLFENENKGLDPSVKEIQEIFYLGQIKIETSVSTNNCLAQNQRSKIEPADDIHSIQNYRKTSTCTQVYTINAKEKR